MKIEPPNNFFGTDALPRLPLFGRRGEVRGKNRGPYSTFGYRNSMRRNAAGWRLPLIFFGLVILNVGAAYLLKSILP